MLLKHNFHIRKLIAEHRATISKETNYDLARMMQEADEGLELARETENANAFAKCVELRAKCNGLIVEKHDMRIAAGFKIIMSGIDDVPIAKITPGAVTVPAALPPPEQRALITKTEADIELDLDSMLVEAEAREAGVLVEAPAPQPTPQDTASDEEDPFAY
jgi:hypothetical protein